MAFVLTPGECNEKAALSELMSRGAVKRPGTGNQATGNGEADLVDQRFPACVSTWRGNRFATDNETGAAAGPGAGCIR
jgi:hypothetical protein